MSNNCLFSVYRYKCTTPHTWPTFAGTDIDGCKRILQVLGHEADVKYGKSKVFIRSPQTLFSIEETRSQKIPTIVLFLQKVQITFYAHSWSRLHFLHLNTWHTFGVFLQKVQATFKHSKCTVGFGFKLLKTWLYTSHPRILFRWYIYGFSFWFITSCN